MLGTNHCAWDHCAWDYCGLKMIYRAQALQGELYSYSVDCWFLLWLTLLCMNLSAQVVSACHDSVVCVWSLETGEKIIQFSNAHGSSEITAMRFDPSKRRLITGGRDGTVRIWNFNNGCCLSELQAVDNEEVKQTSWCLLFRQCSVCFIQFTTLLCTKV